MIYEMSIKGREYTNSLNDNSELILDLGLLFSTSWYDILRYPYNTIFLAEPSSHLLGNIFPQKLRDGLKTLTP